MPSKSCKSTGSLSLPAMAYSVSLFSNTGIFVVLPTVCCTVKGTNST